MLLQKCNVLFHTVGLKCVQCGSYNTCHDSEPADAEATVETADAVQPHDGASDAVEQNIQDT